jgi:hypothetical protein
LEIWAANQPSDANVWQACVSFDSGSLGYNHINSAGDAHTGTVRPMEITLWLVINQSQ